jgi:hypothetical protein
MLTYEQGVTPFRDTKRLSENDKAALMGGTLQKVCAARRKAGSGCGSLIEGIRFARDSLVASGESATKRDVPMPNVANKSKLETNLTGCLVAVDWPSEISVRPFVQAPRQPECVRAEF